jgi:hypothetical protein
MPDLSPFEAPAPARRRRFEREALGGREPMPYAELAIALMWVAGIALICASVLP